MTDDARHTPWFVPERQRALEDFWAVYVRNYDAIQSATLRVAETHPVFGPLVRSTPPGQREAQSARSRALMERGIAGEWEAYETDLRTQGATYAQMGISFAGWYDILRVFHVEMVPRLVEAYGASPDRLSESLLVVQDLLDRAMTIIATQYVNTKENLLLAERRRADEIRERSAELESQNVRIREASRLKSEFLANMSHELRTPLNSIIGFAELLHDGEADPSSEEHDEFLGDILKSGRHLLQLINDVLDLSKVEAGKLEFHPEPVNVASLVQEVAAILRSVTAARMVRLELDVDPGLGTPHIDPGRFKQVLYNYLSNALKFTPNGGSVTVRAGPDGADAFRVEVEDTGAGIRAEDIARLFVEFQQLDSGTAKRHAGTGLGLALTKRLVEAQGGSVGVRSAPGKGSVFHAVLPRRTAGESLPAPRVIEGPSADVPRILVVDDDPRDQSVLVAALTTAGYAVETASTGAQAMSRCRETRFHAITLDLLLPDMNGPEVLTEIRRAGLCRDARVIVVSVVAEKGVVGGCVVDDILPKPVDEDALLRALGRAGVVSGKADVLVVDNDEASLRLAHVMLSQLGYQVVCKADGASALRHAERQRPNAIILDLLMPEMDGFEFLAHFRAVPANASVPVMIWTVKELSSQERVRLQAGAQAIVIKGKDGTASLMDQLKRLVPPSAQGRVGHG